MSSGQISKALALLATFFWSTVAVAFKIGLRELSPPVMLFYVISVSWVILLLFNFVKGFSLKGLSKKDIILAVFGGFLNPFLYYLVLFKAYELLPAQMAQTLNYTWPIVLVVFSVLFFKQKFNYKLVLGMVMSFSGVVYISLGGLKVLNNVSVFGVFLAVGSSLVWALFWLVNKNIKIESRLLLLINMTVGLIFVFIYLISQNMLVFPDVTSGLACVYSGVFEMGVTYIVWLKALRLAKSSSSISHFIYFSPFLGLLFISIFLGETILLSTFFGLVLIILGVLFNEYILRKNI